MVELIASWEVYDYAEIRGMTLVYCTLDFPHLIEGCRCAVSRILTD